jgi:hypothetical protein
MNNGRLEKELLELICECMFIQDIKAYDKSKLQLILKFLVQNNINSLGNIAIIGAGTYSTVFKVSNFVIKIGLAKIREKTIESPNIAKSFVRLNVKFITSETTIVVGIEIQPLAQKYTNNIEEELFDLYCALRRENLIWTDIKYDNVGILNEKLVVVDADSIFFENDSNINWITSLSSIFEKKYKERMNKKI